MPARLVAEFEMSRKLGWPAQDCSPVLHDALLRSVAQIAGKDVSDALHDGSGGRRKPYALSPPWAGASGGVSATIGILDDSLSDLFSEALQLMELIVAGQRLQVKGVEEALPRRTYAELLDTGSEDQWDLEFITPTVFRIPNDAPHPERWILFPEPRLVVRSLARAWNAWCRPSRASDAADRAEHPSIAAPEDLEVLALHRLVIRGYRSLRTKLHLHNTGLPRHPGFIGEVWFKLLDSHTVPDQRLRELNALLEFANYSGIGDKTPGGMGVVRVQQPRQLDHRRRGGLG